MKWWTAVEAINLTPIYNRLAIYDADIEFLLGREVWVWSVLTGNVSKLVFFKVLCSGIDSWCLRYWLIPKTGQYLTIVYGMMFYFIVLIHVSTFCLHREGMLKLFTTDCFSIGHHPLLTSRSSSVNMLIICICFVCKQSVWSLIIYFSFICR